MPHTPPVVLQVRNELGALCGFACAVETFQDDELAAGHGGRGRWVEYVEYALTFFFFAFFGLCCSEGEGKGVW